MKKKLTKSNGIVINFVQLKSDVTITLSLFLSKVELKKRTEVITKDMWYKLHPPQFCHFGQEQTHSSQTTDTTGTTGESKNFSLTRA